MAKTLPKSLTLEEFLNLSETKPASEYIDCKIIQKPIPQGEHSVIQGELTSAANAALKPQQVARAFPELRCVFGGRAIVPDVTAFTWERIPFYETYSNLLIADLMFTSCFYQGSRLATCPQA